MSTWKKSLEKFRVDKYDELQAEISRLRAALEEISTYPVAGDAMVMLDIARKALGGKMSTWDDKPNDYEHAVRLLEAKDAEIARLRAALKQVLTCSDIEAAHHIAYKVLGQGALAKEGK